VEQVQDLQLQVLSRQTCLTANSLLDGADWSAEPPLRPDNDEAAA
jgi:hypothetical protein